MNFPDRLGVVDIIMAAPRVACEGLVPVASDVFVFAHGVVLSTSATNLMLLVSVLRGRIR